MKRVLTVLLVSLGLLFLPAPLTAQSAVHPGDFMSSSVGGCTLGFVAQGSGRTYFMTAAHCTDHVGEAIRLADGSVLGHVAVRGELTDDPAEDWALVEVSQSMVPLVRASVRGHGAPTGYTTPSGTNFLDLLQFSGHGLPFFITDITREQRVGLLVSDDTRTYTAIGLDSWGDSGGPILHVPSGRALGLVSRLCIGVCTSEGPTVQGILAQAAARGFNVALTVP